MRKAVELGLAGDGVLVRFCLGRALGVPRGRPVELAMPSIAQPGDLTAAVVAVTAALAEGRLTPDEALACSQMLDGLPRILAAGYVPPEPTKEEGDAARMRLIDALDRLAEQARAREAGTFAEAEAPSSRID